MRIVLLGCTGQVGWELQRTLQPLGQVIAVDRGRCDLASPPALRALLRKLQGDVIVNAAAYTAVDAAESDPQAAFALNRDAVAVIGEEARRLAALVIHYSTDYVFSGEGSAPHAESDPTGPRSVYGHSKLAGEQALAATAGDWLCFRTSWVYGTRGRNFLRTMLRLARERDALSVVDDQVGAPTWSRLIAEATALALASAALERRCSDFRSETLHMASGGYVSWHGFAEAIIARARAAAVPGFKPCEVRPISSAQYGAPAARPANSRLDCTRLQERFNLVIPHWTVGLDLCMAELLSSE